MTEPPFGAFPPGVVTRAARALANATPASWGGKQIRSILLRIAGGKTRRAFDLEVFGGQRVRLRPVGNVCEKRVFTGDRVWEAPERAAIARIAAARAPEPLHFLDVGANVGLYTLAARAEARAAGVGFSAIAIEPQPAALARLRFNLDASGVGPDEVRVFPWAAVETAGTLRFATAGHNIGEGVVCESGEMAVEGRPIADAVGAAGWAHVDVLKIDIEGGEAPALRAYFDRCDPSLRPRLVIMEKERDEERPATAILEAAGYAQTGATRMNRLFEPAP